MRDFSIHSKRLIILRLAAGSMPKLRRVFASVGGLSAAVPALAAAPDTGWAGAVGVLLLIGTVLICMVAGLIGYALGYPTRYKPLFALAGAITPIIAIVVQLVDHDRRSKEAHAAQVEAKRGVIRLAQAHIDATCADLQASRSRVVDLQRSVNWRVVSLWPGLDVTTNAMDWPLPLSRVTLAFDARYQSYLRKLRFEQSYFESHQVQSLSRQLDYVEHSDSLGLYALARATYWRTLLPRLDDESRQKLSRHIGHDRGPEHLIGYRPRTPLARYRLEVSDVSTREDRNHWTARLRVKVVEIASGDEIFEIERVLPILIDSVGGPGEVRLCARRGHSAIAKDGNFDWLGYLSGEVSAEPWR